jgi:hypothetical protein
MPAFGPIMALGPIMACLLYFCGGPAQSKSRRKLEVLVQLQRTGAVYFWPGDDTHGPVNISFGCQVIVFVLIPVLCSLSARLSFVTTSPH